jgi:hypothetical protein
MQGRQVIATAILSALGACTAPMGREGPAAPAGGALRDASFTFAPVPAATEPGATEAASLVGRALVRRGYREAPDGKYRLEIGFSTAPVKLEIKKDQRESSTAPVRVGNAIVLCRSRRYVLTVGMIDRTNGDILFRNSTSARQCGESLDALLPRLVNVAVTG